MQPSKFHSFSMIFTFLEDDSAAGTIEVLPNMGPTIKANTTSQMEAAITALSAELSKLRTGRASPGTFSISRLSNRYSYAHFGLLLILVV